MKFHFQQFFRAIILGAFGLLFIKLHYTADIYKFINPKYESISQIAAGIFVFFFFIQLFRVWERPEHNHVNCGSGCSHNHGYSSSLSKKLVSYSIIIFPLVTGFSLSPAVLDSSIAEKKGIMLKGIPEASIKNKKDNNGSSVPQDNSSIVLNEELPSQDQIPLPNNNYLSQEKYDEKMKSLETQQVITMNDSIFEPYYEKIGMDPQKYKGKKISLRGFVYKEEGFNSNQVVISRFLVTHCIADASIIGFLTEFPGDAKVLELDTWLEVEGTLSLTNYNGAELPILRVDKWRIIEQPEDPYVYPVLTKIIE